MGSKKLRTQKQAVKQPANVEMPMVQNHSSIAVKQPKTPFYTIFYVVAIILVLIFLFNWIINACYTNAAMNADPSISNNQQLLMEKVQELISKSAVHPILQRIVLSVSILIGLLFFFKKTEKTDVSALGLFNKQKLAANIGIGLVAGFLAILVIYNVLIVFGWYEFTGVFRYTPLQFLWLLEIIVCVLSEELLFRGYLKYKFSNIKPIYMYAISTVLFVLFKALGSTMPSTYITFAVMNIFLMYMYIKFDSPWFGVAFRFMWLLISGLVISIYSPAVPGIFESLPRVENLFAGSRAGFESGLIAATVLALAFVGVKFITDGRLKPGEKHVRKLQKDGTIR